MKYITLVNLLAGDGRGEEVFPEYLTCEDRSAEIAGHVIQWLTDGQKRQARVAELEQLRQKVARSGAAQRAAAFVLEGLGMGDQGLAGPAARGLVLRIPFPPDRSALSLKIRYIWV